MLDATGAVLETTGQTAIDRRRGAARAGSLRISRLAASGTRLMPAIWANSSATT